MLTTGSPSDLAVRTSSLVISRMITPWPFHPFRLGAARLMNGSGLTLSVQVGCCTA